MNPIALTVMLTITLGFTGALVYALATGANWLLAALVIVAIALFVRWG